MKRYTFTECCQLLAIDYRKLRKLLTVASIKPIDGHKLPANASIEDRREKTISAEELDILRGHISTRGIASVAAQGDNVALLRRIEALEQKVRELQGKTTRYEGQQTASIDRGYISVPSPRARIGGSTLPEGWVAVAEMETRHNLPGTTVVNHMRVGKFPFHSGRWVYYGNVVTSALDQEQQRAFIDHWRNHTKFAPCEVAGCACHEGA